MKPRSSSVTLGFLLLAGSLFTGVASAQTPVPSTIVQIRGTASADDGVTMPYVAYANPGSPFRLLCASPCTADLNATYGLYAGFAAARQQVVNLMGVDSLPVNQPFDLHFGDDHWCGTAAVEFAGDSGQYPPYSTTAGTFGCFWFTTPGRYAIPFHYPETSTLIYQVLTSHEFTHTEFFTRHFFSYEDFAKAVSFYVSGYEGGPTITDPCDARLDLPFAGKLIWGMCHQNGFQWTDLAPAMQSINTTFLNGQGNGGYLVNSPTAVYQFRQALNAVLGSDTLDAFLAAKEGDQNYMGDQRTFTTSAGRVQTLSGWASFRLPAHAVAANTLFQIQVSYILPAAFSPVFTFANAYRFERPDFTEFAFQAPMYFQFKYDPSSLPAGADPSTLVMYHYNGTSFQPLAGSRVDAQKMIVSAPITETGFYVAGGSTTANPPTLVIPRAVTGAKVRTHVVLFNASILNPATGQLVYHPQGVAASASDPVIPYSLGTTSGKSLVLPDVLAAFGVTKPGTVDVVPASGYPPDVSVRQVDTGGSGFPGSYVEASPAAGALAVGESALLLAPANAQQEQGHFLVRTFASGVTMTVTARNTSGALLATTALMYPANTLSRVPPKVFGGGLAATVDQTYEVQIKAGSALVLREITESGMAAHNYEYATRVDVNASGPKDLLYLPKVMSSTNPDGSTERTGVAWVNASTSTIKGSSIFHPASGSANVSENYTIQPWQVQTTGDILGSLGQSGTGAFQFQTTAGNLPIPVARLVHAGNSLPFQVAAEPFFSELELAQAGDRMTLVVPDDVSSQDFRIGIRTVAKHLALTIVVYDAAGTYQTQLTKTFPPATSSETSASTFLGATLSGGEILQIFVDGGNGIVYGSGVNVSTGASNFQAARRQPYNY